ncbi:MAG: glycosyltransferase [Gammaproteobacteria bacterium]|nr:glycosyltransferase [Gammaproteobacteria bacterium]
MNRRIGHFIESLNPGGAEQVLLDLCIQNKQHGDIPLILHFNHSFFIQRAAELGVVQIPIPEDIYRTFKSTKTLPIFAYKFRQFLKQHRIDLLHSHLFGPITGAALACYKLIPHVGTLHDIYMIEDKASRIHLIQIAAILNTQLVTVSEHMEYFYRNKARLNHQQLRTIYNGIDPSPQASKGVSRSDPHEGLRNELDIEQKHITLIATGRLVELKCLTVLVQAIHLLNPKTLTCLKVIIVGEGPEEGTLKNLIETLHLGNTISLTGYRNDIPELLSISDIFVQCSRTEGLSCSILEAIASPLPCVVTDVGGNSELVEDTVNGYLVPVNDASELAARISQLIDSEDLRKRFSFEALRRCQKYFLKEPNYLKYHKLYDDLTMPPLMQTPNTD